MSKFDKNKIPLPAHYAIMSKDNQSIVSKNECCLFGETRCVEKAIRSHSIQEASLRKISDSTHHVYSFESPSYKELEGIHRNATYIPKKIGVSNATVFNGFCLKHDGDLFKCIEKEKIEPNVKQRNALHFTAMARAFHFISGAKKAITHIMEYDFPDSHQPEKALVYIAGQASNLADVIEQMSQEKNSVVQVLSSSKPSKDCFLFFRLKDIPDVMFSTLLAPTFDLEGKALLNEEVPADIQNLCVTISSDIVGGYAILQWSKKDRLVNSFISSFIESNYNWNKLLAYLMLLTDFVFSPRWWDDLSKEKQEIIMHFAMAPHFTYLLQDMFVSLKVYKHFLSKDLSFVNWEIVEHKSNT